MSGKKILDEIEDIVAKSTPETVEADIERADALLKKMPEGPEYYNALGTLEGLHMLKEAKDLMDKEDQAG